MNRLCLIVFLAAQSPLHQIAAAIPRSSFVISHSAFSLPLSSVVLGATEPSAASAAIDRARAAEITAQTDADGERRRNKFLELVLLPLGVCFALILLLRRGLFT